MDKEKAVADYTLVYYPELQLVAIKEFNSKMIAPCTLDQYIIAVENSSARG